MGVMAIGLVAVMEQLRCVRRNIEIANTTLETRVLERTRELKIALAKVRTLSGFLPICAWCRKLRGDKDYWHSLEEYISQNTDARLTHAICPECAARLSAAEPPPDVASSSPESG
jgi:hypothetical protein